MQKIDTRTALLDCAQDLVQRVGVNAMSYNDLSQAVGIRKASVHYHFPHKDDLVQALLSRCGTQYHSHYRAIADGELSGPDKLRAIAELFVDSLRDGKMCLVGILSVEHGSLSIAAQQAAADALAASEAVFVEIVESGIRDGSLAKQDANDVAHTYLSLLLGGQIVARSSGNIDAYAASVNAFINGLKP